ncbi:MAG: hypothetical protein BWY65_01311 [Firmicutes bacterium ADurb.Bin373]|nr:MAG: hypothetical protein BWY65_01311 [Firmicutes bacterium ADurb.Bin373]
MKSKTGIFKAPQEIPVTMNHPRHKPGFKENAVKPLALAMGINF